MLVHSVAFADLWRKSEIAAAFVGSARAVSDAVIKPKPVFILAPSRTKRNLYKIILKIQKYFSNLPIFKDDNIRIIDSMSILVCKLGRAYFSKLFKDISTYGYCASKKETYFWLKLHALVTTNGFITNFILTAANIDDRDEVFDLIELNDRIKILADKGYISNDLKNALTKEKEVEYPLCLFLI